MKKSYFHSYPRDIEAGNLIENFLVSAITNLLFWRFYLHLTGYPKIIFGDIYFPHVLTGGILMTLGIILMFIYLNREIKYVSAIICGAGFGLFIDELGKYITQDNNYFYEPAIAIIYVIFIILFLISRIAENFFRLTKEEYGINALEISKNVVMHKFESDDKQQALNLIDQSDIENPIIKMLKASLLEVRAMPKEKPNILHQIKRMMKNFYKNITTHPMFIKVAIFSFVIISLVNFAGAIGNFKNAGSFAQWGDIIFSFISGLIVFMGAQVLVYKISRKFAFELFKLSVLVSIFLTQFFRFLENQLSAITVLILYLVVLSVIQYLIYEESLLQNKQNLS